MRLFVTILVAALAAFGAQRLARVSAAPASERTPSEALELARVVAGIQELRQENARLGTELERRGRGLVAQTSAPEGFNEAEIGAALARWRAARPEGEAARRAGKAPVSPPRAPGELDLASIPILELVQALSSAGLTHPERQELFQRLRDAGRIDEYVAAIERLAAEDPENPELQVALGHAYLQQLFGVGNSPEAGPLAYKSDAAFDRALELDDGNWSARFSKAVSLSNWPAFMGRSPEAIEHFGILLEQQAAQPKRPEFAMTYLFLGNLLSASGEHQKAIETWRAGLELFPNVQDLQQALALANSQGGTQRDAQR